MAVIPKVESCPNLDVNNKKRFKGRFSYNNFLNKESVVFSKKVAKIAERIANKAKQYINFKRKQKMSEVRYKVGDRVIVKSLAWYNENKNSCGTVSVPCAFVSDMCKYCGMLVTIKRVNYNSYSIAEDKGGYSWSDEMFEEFEEGCEYRMTKDVKDLPKDFAECAKLLHLSEDMLYTEAEKLIICLAAYWRIANWAPDWKKNTKKHCVVIRDGRVGVATTISKKRKAAFPTPEMADAFGKNFKKELEMCKEVLENK